MLALAAGGCGYSSPSGANATGTYTISVLGERGAQSFNPNPASLAQGDMVVWRNTDGEVHHIVFDDGSLDTGDIAPGASSTAIRIPVEGASYHCTIHPTMVGSINRATGTPPPCSGPYC